LNAFNGQVSTTTLSGPLTFSGNTLSINQASLAADGYLSSADFNTFNSKISSSSLSAQYPLSYNANTGIFSSSFSTTTANTFSALNTFNGSTLLNGSLTVNGTTTLTNATTTSFAISNVPAAILKTLSNGAVVAAQAGTDYLTGADIFAYPFAGNATTTQIAFNGGATFAGATTTAFAVNGSSIVSSILNVGGAINAKGGVVGNLIGNASTATALQTGRTINGVTFD